MSLRPKASSSSSSVAPKSNTRLFISNLASGVTDAALATLFKPFGRIVALSLIFHTAGPLKGHSKGYAFVEFSKPEEAQRAKTTCEGRKLGGREIGVGFANVQVSLRGTRERRGWRLMRSLRRRNSHRVDLDRTDM